MEEPCRGGGLLNTWALRLAILWFGLGGDLYIKHPDVDGVDTTTTTRHHLSFQLADLLSVSSDSRRYKQVVCFM